MHCAARLIKQIGNLRIAREERSKRMKLILEEAVAFGWDEKQIRNLVNVGPLHQPQATGRGRKT